ncbi:hypothetical protein ACIHCQ_35335 [Streptomyces sp. NPDC052236]|uniref:hypothetical protein n=1 Tax=Streptomyces sp. NPDC052236 TaxID=3365686 RepID=UPI0037D7D452
MVQPLRPPHPQTARERIVALRSLFRHTKKNGQIFRDPTIRVRGPRQTGGVLQALVQADMDEPILDWLDHRRSSGPYTADPPPAALDHPGHPLRGLRPPAPRT